MSATKVVYSFDSAGFYTGPTLAQESPLEPGVWLFPSSTTEDAPPEFDPSRIARWDGSRWNLEEVQPQELPPQDPPHPVELSEDLKSLIRQYVLELLEYQNNIPQP